MGSAVCVAWRVPASLYMGWLGSVSRGLGMTSLGRGRVPGMSSSVSGVCGLWTVVGMSVRGAMVGSPSANDLGSVACVEVVCREW